MRFWWVAAGALLGAAPATIMEILSPAWEPLILAAFLVPAADGAAAGFLAWTILHHKN